MLILILWLPLLGFLSGCLAGNVFGRKIIYLITFNIFCSLFLAIILFIDLFYDNTVLSLITYSWFMCDDVEVFIEFELDSLNITMLCVVTLISFLVHFYSLEYMKEDPFLILFMSYLSLFTFCMIILITASNFVQMFIGWEGVGVTSYLLINFWSTRLQANKSAIKAMLFNRVSDFLMLLAFFGIGTIFCTYDYTVVFSLASLLHQNEENCPFYLSLDFICLFLFLGAMGKSAQLGFHNWLPDAMEGPTPVSALIHAATMVTAGVFLIIKCSALFTLSKSTLSFISLIGATTALFGASVGMYCHDLKKIIAFSTCSQLGYMTMACGLEQFDVAFFHLAIHALFKALLFLGAGSIIHSLFDEQDVRKFGGLLTLLPITYICFLIGSLNLMGIPFLSGFYTKDMILELACSNWTSINFFCYLLGLISVFFTAAYSTRGLLLVFFLKPNASYSYIYLTKENGINILFCLFILSLLSIFCGFIFNDIFLGFGNIFLPNLLKMDGFFYVGGDVEFIETIFKILPLFFTFLGIYFSIYFYLLNPDKLWSLKQNKKFFKVYQFLIKKWYTDRVLNETIIFLSIFFSKIYSYSSLDRGVIELFGPTGIKQMSKKKLIDSINFKSYMLN